MTHKKDKVLPLTDFRHSDVFSTHKQRTKNRQDVTHRIQADSTHNQEQLQAERDDIAHRLTVWGEAGYETD